MAKMYIEGGSQYQNTTVPTREVTERVKTGEKVSPAFQFFGIPIGRKVTPVYEDVTRTVPNYGPASSYGVNDTGRTTPFNPNPTMPDYRSVDNGKGTGSVDWAGGGQSQQYTGPGGNAAPAAQASPFMGLLATLFGKLPGAQQQQAQPYEAALRERPADIQNLVSMTRRPGFGQGGGSGFGQE